MPEPHTTDRFGTDGAIRRPALGGHLSAALAGLDVLQDDAAPLNALLVALGTHRRWEATQLHPLLEARAPGSSLRLASAGAGLDAAAETVALALRALRQAALDERPEASRRAVRHAARLIGQLLLHLDACEGAYSEGLLHRTGAAAHGRERPCVNTPATDFDTTKENDR